MGTSEERIRVLFGAVPGDDARAIEAAYGLVGGIGDKGRGAGPDDLYETVQRGRNWLTQNLSELQRVLCPNVVVRAFINNGDLVAAATGLLGLIPGLGEQKVVGIVVLASRGAIAQWCEGHE